MAAAAPPASKKPSELSKDSFWERGEDIFVSALPSITVTQKQLCSHGNGLHRAALNHHNEPEKGAP